MTAANLDRGHGSQHCHSRLRSAYLHTTVPAHQHTAPGTWRQHTWSPLVYSIQQVLSAARGYRIELDWSLHIGNWCFTFYKKVKIRIKEIPKLLVGAILGMYPARCRQSSLSPGRERC